MTTTGSVSYRGYSPMPAPAGRNVLPHRPSSTRRIPDPAPPAATPQHVAALEEARNRTKIKVEVARFGDSLEASPLRDGMTDILRGWHESFMMALHIRADTQTLHDLVAQLQRILINPPQLGSTPLDEESVLGSDGTTYGSKALRIYLASQGESYNHRSPVDQTNPAPFTTRSHHVVDAAVRCLKNLGLLVHDDATERQYRLIEASGALPDLPTEEGERSWRAFQRQIQLDHEDDEDVQAFEQELQELSLVNSQAAQEECASVAERSDQLAQELFDDLEAVREQGRRDAEDLRRVRGEAAGISSRISTLSQHMDDTSAAIAEVETGNQKLRERMRQTDVEIKKRDDGWMKALLLAGVTIVGCGVGSALIASAIAAATGGAAGAGAVSGTILPISHGGKIVGVLGRLGFGL